MKLEFVRTESEVPALSHGGTSCLITWELKLNGVVIGSESNRYFWEARKESSLEPHWSLQKLHDSVIKGLEQDEAKPVDVAAVRELRKIWYIRDLTTDDFDKAEAMLSALSAEPAQGEQWQCMDIVPRDSVVILKYGDKICFAEWWEAAKKWQYLQAPHSNSLASNLWFRGEPDGWMYLPDTTNTEARR